MRIDVLTHIIPAKYKEGLHKKMAGAWQLKLTEAYPALFDLDARFRVMDKYEGLVRVICTGAPAIEDAAPPKDTVEFTKIANDEMAELVRKYPDRFVAAVACLPMNDVDAAQQELDRAIMDLNFRGIQLQSDINGKPLDSPEFEPIQHHGERGRVIYELVKEGPRKGDRHFLDKRSLSLYFSFSPFPLQMNKS